MIILSSTSLSLLDGYVYVLECERNTFYVGLTENLDRRLTQHFSGEGAVFTRKHKPIRVYELKSGSSERDEYRTWMLYVNRFGLPRVGGYNYFLCRKHGFPWLGRFGNSIFRL